MVSLKWPVSFHRQGDTRLSCPCLQSSGDPRYFSWVNWNSHPSIKRRVFWQFKSDLIDELVVDWPHIISHLWFASGRLCSVSAPNSRTKQLFHLYVVYYCSLKGRALYLDNRVEQQSQHVHKEGSEEHWDFLFWSEMFILLQWLSQQMFNGNGLWNCA